MKLLTLLLTLSLVACCKSNADDADLAALVRASSSGPTLDNAAHWPNGKLKIGIRQYFPPPDSKVYYVTYKWDEEGNLLSYHNAEPKEDIRAEFDKKGEITTFRWNDIIFTYTKEGIHVVDKQTDTDCIAYFVNDDAIDEQVLVWKGKVNGKQVSEHKYYDDRNKFINDRIGHAYNFALGYAEDALEEGPQLTAKYNKK